MRRAALKWIVGRRACLMMIVAHLGLLGATPAFTADFTVSKDDETCNLTLKGKIEPGDFEKFLVAMESWRSEPGSRDADPSAFALKGGPTLCLRSPGGDFVEGLKIANFVAKGLPTRIRPKDFCMSACSWIFMAGTSYTTSGTAIARSMSTDSVLAFHAPFLKVEESAGDAQSYQQAISEIGGNILNLARDITTYDRTPRFDTSLVALALTTPAGTWLKIQTVEQALRWKIELENVVVVPMSKAAIITGCRHALAEVDQNWDNPYLIPSKAKPDEKADVKQFSDAVEYTAYLSKIKGETNETNFIAHINFHGYSLGACIVTIRVDADGQIDRNYVNFEVGALGPGFCAGQIRAKRQELRRETYFPSFVFEPADRDIRVLPTFDPNDAKKKPKALPIDLLKTANRAPPKCKDRSAGEPTAN